jgi:hypothetical protein
MRATIIVFVVLAIASCGGIVLATDQPGDQADVAALELKCEQAREARLKPMRDAEIANCKADRSRDPEYCERFWKDLGDATRLPNGAMKPRLFDDLPECVAAAKAKQAQNK